MINKFSDQELFTAILILSPGFSLLAFVILFNCFVGDFK